MKLKQVKKSVKQIIYYQIQHKFIPLLKLEKSDKRFKQNLINMQYFHQHQKIFSTFTKKFIVLCKKSF